MAIFTYGFPEATAAFAAAQVPLFTLSDLSALLEKATELAYIDPPAWEEIRRWQQAPATWHP